MKIKELPESEKPRERLIKYGAENLSNEDLLSILIGTGTKSNNVKEISTKILTKIKNIEYLSNITLNELTSVKGVGKAKAITILAAIELGKRTTQKTISDRLVINNTNIVKEYFSPIIKDSIQEELLVILLDNKKRLISYKKMYKGTSSASSVSIKEIYNYAIKERADALIIMHNHPSNICKPSTEDINLTNNLINFGKMIGLPLLDHIIVGSDSYYSFYNDISN